MSDSISHISKNHEYFYVQDGFVKSEKRGRFGKFGRVLSWVQGKDYRLKKILDIISEKQLPKTDLYARLIQHFYERKNRLPKSSQQKIDILLTKIFPHTVIPQTKTLLQQILSKEMFENISSITESADVSTKQITICFKDLYKQTHAQEIQEFCSLDPITLNFKDLQRMVDAKKKEQIQNDKKELEKISSEAKKRPAFSTKIDALVVDGLSQCSRVPLEYRKNILSGLFKSLDEHKAKKDDESTTALLQKVDYIRLLRLCCMIQLRPDS